MNPLPSCPDFARDLPARGSVAPRLAADRKAEARAWAQARAYARAGRAGKRVWVQYSRSLADGAIYARVWLHLPLIAANSVLLSVAIDGSWEISAKQSRLAIQGAD